MNLPQNKVYIYQILCKITNKGYIGSTLNPYKRENGHFNQLKRNIHSNQHLQNAYNKYGKDNFFFRVISECGENQRNKVETWFIDFSDYNSEFNIAMSDNRDYSIKSSFKKLNKNDIEKIIELIKQGFILKEISKILKISKGCLLDVIHNRYYSDIKIPEEVIFKYKENTSNYRKKITRNKADKIYCYKTNGEFVKLFSCVPDAAESLNFNKNSVMNALQRGIQLKGYLFYKEERKFGKYIPNPTFKTTKIIVFNKDLVLLNTYNSMTEYSKLMNINVNCINSACNRLTLSYEKFYFVRENQLNKFKTKNKLI